MARHNICHVFLPADTRITFISFGEGMAMLLRRLGVAILRSSLWHIRCGDMAPRAFVWAKPAFRASDWPKCGDREVTGWAMVGWRCRDAIHVKGKVQVRVPYDFLGRRDGRGCQAGGAINRHTSETSGHLAAFLMICPRGEAMRGHDACARPPARPSGHVRAFCRERTHFSYSAGVRS